MTPGRSSELSCGSLAVPTGLLLGMSSEIGTVAESPIGVQTRWF